MVRICTFQIYHLEVHFKGFTALSNETTSTYRELDTKGKAHPQKIQSRIKRISEYVIDETMIKIESLEFIYLVMMSCTKDLLYN